MSCSLYLFFKKIFMKRKFQSKTLLLYVIFILPVIHITSCKKVEPASVAIVTPTPPPPVNRPPIANAGAYQTISLPNSAVTLDASGSTDPDNNITSYAWIKISGPASFNIPNATAVQTQVTNLVQGAYQFELKVTDAAGLFSKDTVQIIVNPIPSGGNSSVWFWTRDLVYNLIYININNETKILDESWGGNGDPSCYPYGGSMDFNLPAGNYTYKTWRQGRDTVSGSVTVIFGICNSVQINY